MDELIKALQILLKYDNPQFPTHCEHDVLYVLVDPGKVSPGDLAELNNLGFLPDSDDGCFQSYRYGSA